MTNVCWYFLLGLIASSGFSQDLSRDKIGVITDEVRAVIGQDWFLTETETGFKVTFCRSCQIRYVDSCASLNKQAGIHVPPRREIFFDLYHADSVCYFPTVSNLPQPFVESDSSRRVNMLKRYQANGVLSFEVRIVEKWDEKKYQEVMGRNEMLKKEILKHPLYKTSMEIFSDYRFYLPEEYLKERTKKFDFYFERLPYSSEKYDYSFMIIPDKPDFFSEPLYIDQTDPVFYDKVSNYLEEERRRTLKIIVLTLAISDFRITY